MSEEKDDFVENVPKEAKIHAMKITRKANSLKNKIIQELLNILINHVR